MAWYEANGIDSYISPADRAKRWFFFSERGLRQLGDPDSWKEEEWQADKITLFDELVSFSFYPSQDQIDILNQVLGLNISQGQVEKYPHSPGYLFRLDGPGKLVGR